MAKTKRYWPQTPENVKEFDEMRRNLKEIPRGRGYEEVNEWLSENSGQTITLGQWKWITSGYQRHEAVYNAIAAKAAEFRLLRKVKTRLTPVDIEKLDLSKMELV